MSGSTIHRPLARAGVGRTWQSSCTETTGSRCVGHSLTDGDFKVAYNVRFGTFNFFVFIFICLQSNCFSLFSLLFTFWYLHVCVYIPIFPLSPNILLYFFVFMCFYPPLIFLLFFVFIFICLYSYYFRLFPPLFTAFFLFTLFLFYYLFYIYMFPPFFCSVLLKHYENVDLVNFLSNWKSNNYILIHIIYFTSAIQQYLLLLLLFWYLFIYDFKM